MLLLFSYRLTRFRFEVNKLPRCFAMLSINLSLVSGAALAVPPRITTTDPSPNFGPIEQKFN
jgi:hypothetical protein